ncbi:MAG: hypothetical protein HFG67_02370 [Firmicutes bacterium]|nr:hypothetical protein [Bacillota bacterium]
MIKIMASLITIMGCGICGILKAMRYKERTDILSDLIQAAEKMKIEMSYRRESLPELILRMSDESTLSGLFFSRVSEIYEAGDGISLKDCWTAATDDIYTQKCLTHDDINAVKELGCELGNCGISGQEKIFDLALSEFRALLSSAENEKAVKGKMYVSLGFTAGVTIVILLV